MKIDILKDNGCKTIDFPDGEQLPGIRNSCTIVPISVVLRELGFKVAWDNRTLSIHQDNKTVRIYEKESYFEMIETIDGESDHIRYDHTDKKEIDSPVVGGRLLTPIRDVLESLCYIVLWDDASKTVKIIPPAENKITVRFNYNYGIEKSSDKPYFERVSVGEAVTLPKPSRTGFVFDGWHIGRTDGTWVGDGKKSPTYYPTESVTLYAYWGRKYNITLVTNGGTVATPILRVDIGVKSVQLPIPDREGYEFVDWFLNSDFQGEPVNADDYHPIDHVTLYAKWRQLTATELMENFERDNKWQQKVPNSSSTTKRSTLFKIGRALFSYGYEPTFIAGFLGHISAEGNFGCFETYWGSEDKQSYLIGWESIGLPNYVSEYSGQYIMNKDFEAVQNVVSILENKGWTKKFGIGCCQWTEERTSTVFGYYSTIKKGNNITYDEVAAAETKLIYDELHNSVYSDIESKWRLILASKNIDIKSSDAAYWAGYCILIGYGFHPNNIKIDNPPDYANNATYISEGQRRGGYAREIYKAMIGKNTD